MVFEGAYIYIPHFYKILKQTKLIDCIRKILTVVTSEGKIGD